MMNTVRFGLIEGKFSKPMAEALPELKKVVGRIAKQEKVDANLKVYDAAAEVEFREFGQWVDSMRGTQKVAHQEKSFTIEAQDPYDKGHANNVEKIIRAVLSTLDGIKVW